jgi:regulatory protein YycH of two-component signal transduction system YycFG
MMELMKSVALTLLVLLSLLQSYLLSYSSPKYEPINQNDYVQTEVVGTQSTLDKLIFPQQIVIHTGKQGYSVLYPEQPDYTYIFDNLKQTTFDGMRRVNTAITPIDWDKQRESQEGLEIRFQYAVPVSVLQSVLQIKGDLPSDNDLINSLWVSVKENREEVLIYFRTNTNGIVYEAPKTNLSVGDVEKLVLRGETMPAYHTYNGDYYLPNESLPTAAYEIPYTVYTAEQLKKSLFVDPGLTRNLTERDGSEIYTDGKRGLQIRNEQRWMNYSDPAAPVDNRPDLLEYLNVAVQFINQHGGWNGTFLLGGIPQKFAATGTGQPFVFHRYYQTFPIENLQDVYYGRIQVMLRRGIISNYERSIIVPDPKAATKLDETLVGGAVLDRLLEEAAKRKSIQTVYPVYRSDIGEETIVVTPAWLVSFWDGTQEYLDPDAITELEAKAALEAAAGAEADSGGAGETGEGESGTGESEAGSDEGSDAGSDAG